MRSNPHALDAPSCSCTRHAVEGNSMSGVTVQSRIQSTSAPRYPGWQASGGRLRRPCPKSPSPLPKCAARAYRYAQRSRHHWFRPSSRDRHSSKCARVRNSPARLFSLLTRKPLYHPFRVLNSAKRMHREPESPCYSWGKVPVETALFFESVEQIYARVFRTLKPRTPLPAIEVRFRKYANANSRIRLDTRQARSRYQRLAARSACPHS